MTMLARYILNRNQKTALIIGLATIALACLYPPYALPGDIVPDIQFSLLGNPPVSAFPPHAGSKGVVFTALLIVELVLVIFGTVIAIVASFRPAQNAPSASSPPVR